MLQLYTKKRTWVPEFVTLPKIIFLLTPWCKCFGLLPICWAPSSAILMVRQEGLQGIFRDYTDKVLGCFACSIGVQTMLFAELFAVIRALEIVKEKGWHKVWLERDSELVIKTFKDHFVVPWCLRMNCLFLFLFC